MEFEKNKIEWLDYDLLEEHPHIIGRTYLRQGGTSTKAFSSLNLSDRVGDHPDCVKVNRELVRKALGVADLVFFNNQPHGINIVTVTKENAHTTLEGDALFTKEKNIALCITHADCQAAIFYDPMQEAIAVVHAGWKGLVQNIYGHVVDFFVNDVGSKADDLLVCISPSIGPDHAEFKNYKKEIPEEFWDYRVEHDHFNLWEIAKSQLRAKDILPERVELVETCTYCNPKDYYSFRRDKETGRHATIVAIKG